jgi:Fibronectin type III domain
METVRVRRVAVLASLAVMVGGLALPSSPMSPAHAQPLSVSAGALLQVDAAVTPPPVDRFENRRSVGQEGVVLVGSRGLIEPEVGRIPKVDIRRIGSHLDYSKPPVMTYAAVESSRAKSNQADFASAAVEVDLDMVKYPDGVWRPSLEPGLAHAGLGLGCAGADDFCVSWSRPKYNQEHRFDGFGQTYTAWTVQSLPSPGTDVALVSGRFGQDQERSLVLAYTEATTLEVKVAHIRGQRMIDGQVAGLRLEPPILSLGKVALASPGVATSPSLAVGDFAGTGSEQIAVVWAPDGSVKGNRQYRAALLGADDQGALQQMVSPTTFTPNLADVASAGNNQVTPGVASLRDTRLHGVPTYHLVVGAGIQGYASLDELALTPDSRFERTESPAGAGAGGNPHSHIASLGDITGDGLDDVASLPGQAIINQPLGGLLDVINFKPEETPSKYQRLSTYPTLDNARMTVLDVRPSKSQVLAPVPGKVRVAAQPQIAITSTWGLYRCFDGKSELFMSLMSIDDKGTTTLSGPITLAECTNAPEVPVLSSFALDGRTELGDPVKGQYTSLEPSVILNAPPTHFDVLDGKMYDPNFCYAGNQYLVPAVCLFDSAYKHVQEATTEVTSQATEDWSVSATASAGFSLFGLAEVQTEFTGGYGENFTAINATKTTDTVQLKVKALNTDKVYVIKRTYDTLEYPVYQPGGTQPKGYVLATTPHTVAKRWLDINSPDAVNLNVNHQPGNILSYPEDVSEQENPFLSPSGRGDPDKDPLVSTFADREEFELSDSSSYEYTLSHGKVDESKAALTKDWNVGASIKGSGSVAGLVEVGLEVKGEYKNSNLNSTSTTIGSTTDLEVTLGGIDESFGETAYTVKPFAYWDESAALVLDYAVSPSIAPRGAPKTWWQQMYGKQPDITMKLPRLLDYEKQAGISSDSARFISPGVQVFRGPCSPEDPLALSLDYPQPRAPLCLRAQIENYSLKDYDGDTEVTFYDGDPDVGGKELGKVMVTKPVAARESEFAYLDWTPDARYAGSLNRIFAVVDSGGAVEEIHEDNNKGYRMYRAAAVTEVAPRAPEEVEAESEAGRQVNVSWMDPLNLAQPAGHQWRVVAYPDSGGTPLETVVPADQMSVVFNDVAPGRYRVAVFSVTADQSSPASHPSEPVDVVIEVSEAPTGVTGTPGDGTIDLTWNPPTKLGGAGIDSYRIREFRAPGQTFPEPLVEATVDGATTGLTLEGLTNGRAYRFTVEAVNSAGTGPVSAPSNPVTPSGLPLRPTNVRAVASGAGNATVSWSAPPASPARSAVTGYEVVATPGGRIFSVNRPTEALEVEGLGIGTEYTFTVQAKSLSGPGQISEPSNALVLPGSPSAPRNVTAAPGAKPGSARITWVAPADTGGVQIDGYEVCLQGGCQTVGGSASEVAFADLQVGVPLTFTVVARNVAGLTSAPRQSNQITLASAPKIAITSGPAEGAFTTPDVVIGFEAVDSGDVRCYIDGVVEYCGSPVRLSGLADGAHTFQAQIEGGGGSARTPLLTWQVDDRPPTARIDDLASVVRSGSSRLGYSGKDPRGSGLSEYAVRTRRAAPTGAFSDDEVATEVTSESERLTTLSLDSGQTVCASVRTTDRVGNESDWSAWKCSTRPVDQQQMRAIGAWKRDPGRSFSDGAARRTNGAGDVLAMRVGQASDVWVQAVTCRDCGRVEVSHRGQVLDVLNLSRVDKGQGGKSRTHVKEFRIPWPEAAWGDLRLRSLGGGPVIIDGVIVVRDK